MPHTHETNMSIMVAENGFVVQLHFPYSTKRPITCIAKNPEDLLEIIHEHAKEVVYIYTEVAAGRMTHDGKRIALPV